MARRRKAHSQKKLPSTSKGFKLFPLKKQELRMTSRILKALALVMFCAVTLPTVVVAAEPVSRLLTLQFPPYSIESGPNAPGAFGELMLAMAKRNDPSPAQIEFLPWARAQMIAQTDPHAVIFPMDRSPEREDKYRWIAQLHCRPVGFVALSSFGGDLDHGEKLTHVRVGVLRSSPSLKEIQALKVEQIIEDEGFANLARMLEKHMIDVIYGTQEAAVYELKLAGLKSSAIKVGKPSFTRGVWLGGNLAMPESEVAQWKQAFNQVKRDGVHRKILRKYEITETTCS